MIYIMKYVRVDLTESCGVVKISVCMKYQGFHFEESMLLIGYKFVPGGGGPGCSQNSII